METNQERAVFANSLIPRNAAGFISRDGGIYEALGVSPTASADEIREAFYARARLLHPDRNPGDPASEETFKAIAGAAEIVRDRRLRQLYDKGDIDALGRPTPKGTARRRRSLALRAFAAYFICPFAAGVAGLYVFLWSQAPSEPRDGPLTVASAAVATAESDRLDGLSEAASLLAQDAPLLAGKIERGLVRFASLDAETQGGASGPRAAAGPAIGEAWRADRNPRLPPAEFEALAEAAASNLADQVETRASSRMARSRESDKQSSSKTAQRRDAKTLNKTRERLGEALRDGARRSTVVALAADRQDGGEMPFARRSCQLTKACRLNQEMCAC